MSRPETASTTLGSLLTISALTFGIYYAFYFGVMSLLLLTADPNPIWIPAGVGILLCSLFSQRALPGLALAIFVSDLTMGWSSDLGYTSQNFLYTSVTTAVKTAQYYIAGRLIVRFLERLKSSQPLRQLFKLYVSVGALPSIPIATAYLLLFQQDIESIQSAAWAFYIIWFGDSLGVIALLPVIVMLQSVRGGGSWMRSALYCSIPIALILLLITAGAISRKAQYDALENLFQGKADAFVLGLEDSLREQKHALRYLRKISLLGWEPSLESFKRLAHEVTEMNPGLRAFAWLQPVMAEDRVVFTQQLREQHGDAWQLKAFEKDGSPFDFSQAPYSIVLMHTFPEEGNLPSLGLDLANHALSKEWIRRAYREGMPMSSPPVKLVQGNEGFVVYAPIRTWNQNSPISLEESPQFGAFSFVYDFETLVDSPMPQQELDLLRVSIRDITESSNDGIEASISKIKGQTMELIEQPDFVHSTVIPFHNRTWEVTVHANEIFMGQNRSRDGMPVLLLGFFLISVVGMFTIFLFYRSEVVEREVLSRTEELALAKEKAEESTRLKNEFLAITNHELRTPLNGIIATAELLGEEENSPRQKELIQMLQTSSNLLLNLINDVLDLSRLEAGRFNLINEPLKPSDLQHVWHSLFQNRAKKKGIELRIRNEIPSDLWVEGDYTRIHQIGLNLIGNAVKFTETGHVEVRLDHREMEENQTEVTIAVQDTGPGIPSEVIPRLFQAFEQGAEDLSRKHGGTGLGLAISQRVAERMGATLTVESNHGKGSCFTFKLALPIISAPENSAPKIPLPEATHGEVLAENSAPPGNTILVVEDNVINQQVMRAMLKSIGVTCEIVGDGKSAVPALEKAAFGLVLLDIQLPDISGTEVALRIRAHEESRINQIPILALTASNLEETRRASLDAGMNDFLTKPIRRDPLQQAIEKWKSRA